MVGATSAEVSCHHHSQKLKHFVVVVRVQMETMRFDVGFFGLSSHPNVHVKNVNFVKHGSLRVFDRKTDALWIPHRVIHWQLSCSLAGSVS